MFKEIVRYLQPQRIENEIDTLSAGEFCGRDKIAISSDQDNPIYLLLETDSGDVQTNPHVDTFLTDIQRKVLVSESYWFSYFAYQPFLGFLFKAPSAGFLCKSTKS